MATLTKRQKQIYDFTKSYINKKGISPTLEEIKKHFRLSSLSTIHQHIGALVEKGFIAKDDNSARGISLIEKTAKLVKIPLLGTIAAGQPIEAIQEKETIAVPQNKLPRSGECYALRVVGNSMIDEGINNGDVVLIKQQAVVDNGQKVVALIDNHEATLKKFYKERGHIRLQPANKNMEPLIFRNGRNVSIQGIVLDVIRDIGISVTETVLPQTFQQTDKKSSPYFAADNILIYKDDILKINSIPYNSVDLIVTSPPYNVDIHYNSHADDLSYEDYLEFTQKWIKKCFDLTKSEGRFLLNIPLDKNKGGQKSVGADITKIAKDIGWKYHSTIIWNEGNISRRTAWGSFMSASAPYVIAPVELILVLYKDGWKKNGGSRKNDITKKEFMDWTNGVWTFNGQSKKGAGGHPAPFPIELPRRCIKLFSFIDDTILDPFLGSGSTLIASYLHGRKGVGVDIDAKYCDIAINRLQQEAKVNQSSLLK
ncbi:MAG: transcriptional repressor LexA [Candidatus Vogelbacteria bacterium]|nr:transcriptional repressor LexA [Candidatus Vogelbacteria bacterium]